MIEIKNCLVIIDVQNGFLSEKTNHIPSKIEQLLDNDNIFNHIVGTQFINVKGSPYIELLGWNGLMDEESRKVSSIVIDKCERIFMKTTYSCFNEEFEAYIKDNNISKLYFLGIDTDCCVLKSVFDCFERNIPFEVLINYCASNGGIESHKAAMTVMKRAVGRRAINIKM